MEPILAEVVKGLLTATFRIMWDLVNELERFGETRPFIEAAGRLSQDFQKGHVLFTVP